MPKKTIITSLLLIVIFFSFFVAPKSASAINELCDAAKIAAIKQQITAGLTVTQADFAVTQDYCLCTTPINAPGCTNFWGGLTGMGWKYVERLITVNSRDCCGTFTVNLRVTATGYDQGSVRRISSTGNDAVYNFAPFTGEYVWLQGTQGTPPPMGTCTAAAKNWPVDGAAFFPAGDVFRIKLSAYGIGNKGSKIEVVGITFNPPTCVNAAINEFCSADWTGKNIFKNIQGGASVCGANGTSCDPAPNQREDCSLQSGSTTWMCGSLPGQKLQRYQDVQCLDPDCVPPGAGGSCPNNTEYSIVTPLSNNANCPIGNCYRSPKCYLASSEFAEAGNQCDTRLMPVYASDGVSQAGKCVGDTVKLQWRKQSCSLHDGQNIAEPDCIDVDAWTTQETCGCVIAQDAPANLRCNGSWIQDKQWCNTPCVANNGAAMCANPWPQWKNGINCGTPQNVSAGYCQNGIQCTLTATYPGQCFYKDGHDVPCNCGVGERASCSSTGACICQDCTNPNTGVNNCHGPDATTMCTVGSVVGGCKAPSVNIVCNGPCISGANACTPSGTTQACAGGNQTCGANGQWGPCVAGSCPAGQTNPHFECVGGVCKQVNTCGVNADCSTCGAAGPACPVGQTNPHFECVGGVCSQSNTCGVNADCSTCGAACDGSNNCVQGGTGKACTNSSECANSATKCDASKNCTASGTGIACSDGAQCAASVNATSCNVYDQCVPGGGGMACTASTECSSSQAGCDFYGKCITGGAGKACTDDAQCGSAPTCNVYNQCVVGGGGKSCASNADCTSSATSRCDYSDKCSTSGTGLACSSDTECNGPSGCDANDKCVAGGQGKSCTSDATCSSATSHCDYSDKCSANGTGLACSADSQCVSSTCDPWNRCIAGGWGMPCAGDADCSGSVSRCDYSDKCSANGTGVACSSDVQCASAAGGCDINDKCVAGGSGKSCTGDGDCTGSRCNYETQKCSATGTGIVCDADIECKSPTTCDIYDRCFQGGWGRPCDGNTICSDSTTRCDYTTERCTATGTGLACDSDTECQNVPTYCDANDRCSVFGTGRLCTDDETCRNSKTNCDYITQSCSVYGTGFACDDSIQCTDTTSSCDPYGFCIPGGGGIDCTSELDCQAGPFCNEDGQCSANGFGIACDISDPYACQTFTACDSDNQCVPGGEGRLCNDPIDCTTGPFCDDEGKCSIYGTTEIACDDDTQCQSTKNPPGASGLGVDRGAYCTGITSTGIATFLWTYTSETGEPEDKYQFQVSTNSDFEGHPEDIITDYIATNVGTESGHQDAHALNVLIGDSNPTSACAPNCDHINYNQTYYWRVKVWEIGNDESSDWADYSGSYTYPFAHPAPSIMYDVPAYDFDKKFPLPGEKLHFVDSSFCYNDDGTSYFCQCNPASNNSDNCPSTGSRSYSWVFGDDSRDSGNLGTSSDVGFTNHIYRTAALYNSSLTICDEIDCCQGLLDIRVKSGKANELPKWKEIAPF